MTSRQASLPPLVIVGARGGDGHPVRYATVSDLYGPFREDSMELREERAYQRGMMEHLRESVEGLKNLDAHHHHHDHHHDGVSHYETAGNYSDQGEAIGVGSDHGQDANRRDLGLQHQEVGSSILYRPRPTYYELEQKVKPRPLAAPPVTYARWLNPPKTYLGTRMTDTEASNHTHSVNQHRYPDEWIQQELTIESPWDQYQHGMLENRGVYRANGSHELNSSRAPPTPLLPPFPVTSESVSILHPLQSTALPTQGYVYYGGYHGSGYDRNLGNADPRNFVVDVNVNVLPEASRGQRVQKIHENPGQSGIPYPLVPPLDLNQPPALPQQPHQV